MDYPTGELFAVIRLFRAVPQSVPTVKSRLAAVLCLQSITLADMEMKIVMVVWRSSSSTTPQNRLILIQILLSPFSNFLLGQKNDRLTVCHPPITVLTGSTLPHALAGLTFSAGRLILRL